MIFRKALTLALAASLFTPAFAQFGFSFSTVRFGGTGADADITIAGATNYTGPIQKNAKKFTVNAGQTLTGLTASPIQILALAPVVINGTITVTGIGYAGGVGCIANAGVGGAGGGPGGGDGYENLNSGAGAGGGGFGGVGGNGGVTGDAGAGRRCHGGNIYAFDILGGSGGGGGMGVFGTGVGGVGGAGGGCLLIQSAKLITVSTTGIINANGSNGAAGAVSASGGGGGGSGGLVFMASQTGITLAGGGAINCNGGNGGNANGGGGGGSGGGGRWGRWYPTGTLTVAGTFSATTGTGGTGNGGVGAAGTTFDIIGVPNSPLAHWLIDRGGMITVCSLADKHYEASGGRSFVISQRALAKIASCGNYADYVAYVGENESHGVSVAFGMVIETRRREIECTC